MAKSSIRKKKKKVVKQFPTTHTPSTPYNYTPLLIIGSVLAIIFTIYIGYRASISDRKLVSIGLLALVAGVLWESIRVMGNLKKVAPLLLASYFIGFLSFLPFKRELQYNFENHIQVWPYYIIFIFSLLMIIFNSDKLTAKLTEGITLLQSLSFMYWILDYGFLNIDHWFTRSLLVVALLLCFFSIVQALTYIRLSRTTRLVLSVWSTMIMLAFAADNIYGVYKSEDIENTRYLSDGLLIGLQFFLLGISTIYIAQNVMLLTSFLPGKNGNYSQELKEIKKDHLNRYSDQQVAIGHSLLCILFAIVLYGLNYHFQVLPRYTMIWLVFLVFPLLLQFMNGGNSRRRFSR